MAQSQTSEAIEIQDRDLPSLLERLAADLATLFDQKVTLLKIELKKTSTPTSAERSRYWRARSWRRLASPC
jgi:hypothetical protein